MTDEERVAYEHQKAADDEAAANRVRNERDRHERDAREKDKHVDRVREWFRTNRITNGQLLQDCLKLKIDEAQAVMQGNLTTALDKEAVVMARIRKFKPADKLRLTAGISPGQMSDDPAISNDALIRLYSMVMSISLPPTEETYENYLTKRTMVMQNPNGEEVTCQVKVPGRNPDKQMMRELVCGEMMGMCFPGRTRDEILAEMERMKHTQELLKRERTLKKDQKTYGRPSAMLGGGARLQITAGGAGARALEVARSHGASGSIPTPRGSGRDDRDRRDYDSRDRDRRDSDRRDRDRDRDRRDDRRDRDRDSDRDRERRDKDREKDRERRDKDRDRRGDRDRDRR